MHDFRNIDERLAFKHEAMAVYKGSPGHCADEASTKLGVNSVWRPTLYVESPFSINSKATLKTSVYTCDRWDLATSC